MQQAASVRVKVYFTPVSTGVPSLVTSVTTTASGGYIARVYPKVSGSYRVAVAGVAGYADSTSGVFSVTSLTP